jgi:hypothetical protein
MQLKFKVFVARSLARRIEINTRSRRRALRDYQRAEWEVIHAADRRALGLRLYAAWSCKEKRAINYPTLLATVPREFVTDSLAREPR